MEPFGIWGALQKGLELGKADLGKLGQQVILVGKVVVESSGRHPDPAGHLPEGSNFSTPTSLSRRIPCSRAASFNAP